MEEEGSVQKATEERGGTISADTFRRLFLLNMVDGFEEGSYGLTRLHKITYIAQRDPHLIKAFEFKRYLHGQYSETLDIIKDQLISTQYITAIPLDTAKIIRFKLPDEKEVTFNVGGNLYTITDSKIMGFYRDALREIAPDLKDAIQMAINDYGYLSETELLTLCYKFPEFLDTDFEDIILESDLPEKIKVDRLSYDDCEELDLSLDPKFISSTSKIIEGIHQSKLHMESIERLTWIG